LVTVSPPNTIAPSLYRVPPQEVPQRLLSQKSTTLEPHVPARSISCTEMQARPTGNISLADAAKFVPHTTPAQMLPPMRVLATACNLPGDNSKFYHFETSLSGGNGAEGLGAYGNSLAQSQPVDKEPNLSQLPSSLCNYLSARKETFQSLESMFQHPTATKILVQILFEGGSRIKLHSQQLSSVFR
jgi:hypothetical protein